MTRSRSSPGRGIFASPRPLGQSLSDGKTDALSGYRYVRLRKSGYTTFQAIETAAAFFGIEPGLVSYCGLKDEDAITDQMIAFPGDADLSGLPEFNCANASGERFPQLIAYGLYPDPLAVGGLAGNAFRIRIGSIPSEIAGALREPGRALPISVINYYDTQRFGVPAAPKTTHEMGAALLAADHDRAFGLLKKAKTPESAMALNWQGPPQAFFDALEPRVVAFFMSADSSFKWNQGVESALEERLGPDRLIRYFREGIEFVAAKSTDELADALSRTPTMEYRRYRPEAGGFASSAIARPTLIHAVINIESIDPDDTLADRFSAVVSFFLPSGAYATNVVNQLLLSMECNRPTSRSGKVTP